MYRCTHLAVIADFGLEPGVAQRGAALLSQANADALEVVFHARRPLSIEKLDVQHQL